MGKMNRQLLEFSYGLRKERKRKSFLIIVYIILIITFINLVFHFIIFPVKQVSSSMIPDIQEQSYLFTTSFVPKLERGDVVLIEPRKNEDVSFFKKIVKGIVYFFTASQISITEDKNFPGTKPHIRRVVGIPGDSIYMRDYVLYVKPAGEKHYLTEFEVSDKEYNLTFYTAPADWDSSIGTKGSFDEIVLGDKEYFVLGDNRKSCSDSRLWGPLDGKYIKGKIILCYFPFKNIKKY